MPDLVPGPRRFIRYLYSIRAFIAVVLLLFFLSMALGYVVPLMSPELAKELISGLEGKAAALEGKPPLVMMWGIFSNNAAGALMCALFGLVAGIFPSLFMISNGMVIGIMLETLVAKLGIANGVIIFLVGVLPHGIFELPAIFISAAIGLKLGYEAVVSIVRRRDEVTPALMDALPVLVFWVLPLLLVAAFIETFVTGALLEHFVHSPIFI